MVNGVMVRCGDVTCGSRWNRMCSGLEFEKGAIKFLYRI
jgi:hypothetical protein